MKFLPPAQQNLCQVAKESPAPCALTSIFAGWRGLDDEKWNQCFFVGFQDSLHNDPNNISLCLTLAFSDTVKQGRSIWAKRLCVLDGSQKNREKWKEEV